MGNFETATELAILVGARNPQWDLQAASTGAPPSINAGTPMQNAVIAQLQVELREDVAKHTARMNNPVFAVSSTWTVTIAGNAVAYAAGALDTFVDVLAGLIAALPGVPAADALVTFSSEDVVGDGILDTLVIRGKSETAYQTIVTATGAAVVDLETDATSANMKVLKLPKTTTLRTPSTEPPGTWGLDTAIGTVALTTNGYNNNFVRVNGSSRAYVELDTIIGVAGDSANGVLSIKTRVLWGPGVLE